MKHGRLLTRTLEYDRALKNRWPGPLAAEWQRTYPFLFDQTDLRIATNQPKHHFCEWFAAIEFFKAEGAHSLHEKYTGAYRVTHQSKYARLQSIMGKDTVDELDAILRRLGGVSCPDLFLFMPDYSRLWFAEVKGPGDALRPGQEESHQAIMRDLGLDVELVWVKPEWS